MSIITPGKCPIDCGSTTPAHHSDFCVCQLLPYFVGIVAALIIIYCLCRKLHSMWREYRNLRLQQRAKREMDAFSQASRVGYRSVAPEPEDDLLAPIPPEGWRRRA